MNVIYYIDSTVTVVTQNSKGEKKSCSAITRGDYQKKLKQKKKEKKSFDIPVYNT